MIRGMNWPLVLAAVACALPAPPSFAADRQQKIERSDIPGIRARAMLDCTLKFTNDYVQDLVLMQDTTFSPEVCRAACADYAEKSLVSMREAVRVLRYTCHYRSDLVADVDLKQG